MFATRKQPNLPISNVASHWAGTTTSGACATFLAQVGPHRGQFDRGHLQQRGVRWADKKSKGFHHRRRQRSSLLLGVQNWFNFLPLYSYFAPCTIIWKKEEFTLIFKSSWCKIDSATRNWINSVPQAAATTFAYFSVYILNQWVRLKCSSFLSGYTVVNTI